MEFNIVEKLLGLTLLGTEWILWLLIVLSVVSIAIMIERLFFFSKMRIDFQRFSNDLVKSLIDNDIESSKRLCESKISL
jgi:biopolymer transport protein ExbB/TolQ